MRGRRRRRSHRHFACAKVSSISNGKSSCWWNDTYDIDVRFCPSVLLTPTKLSGMRSELGSKRLARTFRSTSSLDICTPPGKVPFLRLGESLLQPLCWPLSYCPHYQTCRYQSL